VPNPRPQAISMVFENFLSGEQGWDVWRGRTIVPDKLADLPASEQWTEQTGLLARKVGQSLGVSPMKIDHMIEQSTGGMGKVLSLKQIPGRRFVTTPLAYSNQPVQDFYELLDKMREAAALKKLRGEGAIPPMLSKFEATARKLSSLRKKSRTAKTESEKSKAQNESLNLAKKQVELYRRFY